MGAREISLYTFGLVRLTLRARKISLQSQVGFDCTGGPGDFFTKWAFALIALGARDISLWREVFLAGTEVQGDFLMMWGFVWLALGAREISLWCETYFVWHLVLERFPYNVRFGLAWTEGYGYFLMIKGLVWLEQGTQMWGLVWLKLGARKIFLTRCGLVWLELGAREICLWCEVTSCSHKESGSNKAECHIQYGALYGFPAYNI